RFHIDALRLDAVHAITDFSAYPFLAELNAVAHRRAALLGRQIALIAESDQNDPRVVGRPEVGGFGLDAQWSDDFHHAVHTLLTGERDGYYEDFGAFAQLARVYRDGWVYGGDYSVHRQRRHGQPADNIPASRLVVCVQNHDQVGNRMLGERLTALLPFEGLKLAAALLLLSPYLPMLFMGEEYGEPAPFLYFVNHGDEHLVEAVRQGRKNEFAAFVWKGEPPDPQAEATRDRSRLDHTKRQQGKHQVLFGWYRELIRLRKTLPALAVPDKSSMRVTAVAGAPLLLVQRQAQMGSIAPQATDQPAGRDVVLVFNVQAAPTTVTLPWPAGRWQVVLDSTRSVWSEPGTSPAEAGISTIDVTDTGTVTLTCAPFAVSVWSR
ncbi:MAG: DUF3459 domain-containing protein, partial [Chloroflexaceae bacterium]|nr:DUF3459 domain-containing protein [Chloroflexaceae bacterium]